MKISNKEYLEKILSSNKMELKELEIKHRITIAEYNTKRELYQNQINSIEMQLEENQDE